MGDIISQNCFGGKMYRFKRTVFGQALQTANRGNKLDKGWRLKKIKWKNVKGDEADKLLKRLCR